MTNTIGQFIGIHTFTELVIHTDDFRTGSFIWHCLSFKEGLSYSVIKATEENCLKSYYDVRICSFTDITVLHENELILLVLL